MIILQKESLKFIFSKIYANQKYSCSYFLNFKKTEPHILEFSKSMLLKTSLFILKF